MVAMDENVSERIIILGNLIFNWEIWDIDDDCSCGFQKEAQGGEKNIVVKKEVM
jgi:hypothetical protein